MISAVTRATVDPRGVVRLELPVGAELAGREVDVTIRPVDDEKDWHALSQEEYARRVLRLAGSFADPPLVRPEQGEFDVRESFE